MYVRIFPEQSKILKQCSHNIISLRDDSKIYGRFFLGSGTINEIDYYYYYKKLNNTSYKIQRVKSFRSIIHETDIEPRVDTYFERVYFTKYTKFMIGIFLGEYQDNYNYRYDIYVPEGTIIKEMVLK